MPRYSVVPDGKGWEVQKYGTNVSNHRKKERAVEMAKQKARGHAGEAKVRIHRSNGTVQNVVTYD